PLGDPGRPREVPAVNKAGAAGLQPLFSVTGRFAVLLLPPAFEQVADTFSCCFARRRSRCFFVSLMWNGRFPLESDRVFSAIRVLPRWIEIVRRHALLTVASTATPLRRTVLSFCFLAPPSFRVAGSLGAIATVALTGLPSV